MPKDLSEMNAEELSDALTIRVFEANLIIRALVYHGVQVAVDMVDRGDGRTEIVVLPGEVGG